MRRSICYCEPSSAFAGEINTWKFNYTTATDLPKGTLFRFDLCSDGRDIDWEIPSVNLDDETNVIYAQLENGKILKAVEVAIPDAFQPHYEFTLPAKLEAGQTFSVVIGSSKHSSSLVKKNGTQAQTYAQRRRPFSLYIDMTGKRRFQEPEIFTIDIRGSALHHINVTTPSFVTRNKRFDVTVRFEDEFGNLTSLAPENTLIELSHEHLRENLNWKLFVPETGFINLPNLYFNEVGIYTIQLRNTNTNERFFSAPIKCFSEASPHLFWGLLHGESVRVDSTENIESCLRHFRDEKSFNFYATSNFESQEETSNEMWKHISQNVTEFDEADRFTTLLGLQWVGEPKEEGVRQFIFSKEAKQVLRKKDAKYSSLKKIYKAFSPKDILSIPSFTMGKGFEYDFKEFQPEFERVVEIYNSWGCSERTAKEGNTFPIKGSSKKGVVEAAEGSVLRALQANKRFGFVAGGLDDRGIYGGFFEGDQEQYTPGLTAIIAKEHTRASLWEALYNRSCYATTGARMIIHFSVAGVSMGGETNTTEKHGLTVNRHLSAHVAGTKKLKTVEIIRNGEVIKTFKPTEYHFHFEYDDLTSLDKVAIRLKDGSHPFVFYYLRVVQEDGHIAWSSPIWVDYHGIPAPGTRKSRASTRVAKKTMAQSASSKEKSVEEDFEDDFDDIDDFDDE